MRKSLLVIALILISSLAHAGQVEIVVTDPVVEEAWTLHVVFDDRDLIDEWAFWQKKESIHSRNPYDYLPAGGMEGFYIQWPEGCEVPKVPEPETWMMLLLGAFVFWRKPE